MFSFSRWCISAPCYRFHWLVLNGDVFCQRSDGVRVNSKYDLSVSLHIRRYTGCFISILAYMQIYRMSYHGILAYMQIYRVFHQYRCIYRYTGCLIIVYLHIKIYRVLHQYPCIYRYTGCLIMVSLHIKKYVQGVSSLSLHNTTTRCFNIILAYKDIQGVSLVSSHIQIYRQGVSLVSLHIKIYRQGVSLIFLHIKIYRQGVSLVFLHIQIYRVFILQNKKK